MTNDTVTTAPVAVIEPQGMEPLATQIILDRMAVVQDTMKAAMTEGIHYGKVPGTDKPALLKPGAEILCSQFMLSPEVATNMIGLANEHREYVSVCTLRHSPSGRILAKVSASASTMEKKYRYRIKKLVCPKCSQSTVFKDKKTEGRWYCWLKQGGCGENFQDDPRITEQSTGREENPDLADSWNTIRKMCEKRAMVAAVLIGTGCSSIFTQDLEDQKDYDDWAKAETKRNGTAASKPKWVWTAAEKDAFAVLFYEQWDMAFDPDLWKSGDYTDDIMNWSKAIFREIETGALVVVGGELAPRNQSKGG